MTDEVKGCYACENRTLGCHATCEIYKKYKKRNECISKNRREYMEYRAYMKCRCDEYKHKYPK